MTYVFANTQTWCTYIHMHTCKCIQIAYASWIHKHSHNIHIHARTHIWTYILSTCIHSSSSQNDVCALSAQIHRVETDLGSFWRFNDRGGLAANTDGKVNSSSSHACPQALTLLSLTQSYMQPTRDTHTHSTSTRPQQQCHQASVGRNQRDRQTDSIMISTNERRYNSSFWF